MTTSAGKQGLRVSVKVKCSIQALRIIGTSMRKNSGLQAAAKQYRLCISEKKWGGDQDARLFTLFF